VNRLRRDSLGFLLEGALRFGGVFRFRVGPRLFHLVSDPDLVKQVLQDRHRQYPRSWVYERTKVVIGESLVSTDGPPWQRRRQMIQPGFHHRRIAALADLMTAEAEAMVRRWRARGDADAPFDVAAEMNRLTLDIAGRALFGKGLGNEAAAIRIAVAESGKFLERRLGSLVPLPIALPSPAHRRFRAAHSIIDAIAARLIAERRSARGETGDVLALLLDARDEETGEGLTDREIRDQVLTFMVAGSETTAVALSWTWYLLDRHPDADRRLRAEFDEVLGGRTPTAEDVPRLRYTRMAIEEALRLYPPVPGVARDARADDVLGGYDIPARSTVVLSPYVTHRLPEHWESPEVYDPDRFAPERAAARPQFAFFPFLGGPHQCIGKEFAMLEAILVVATIAQAFRLRLAPGATVEPEASLALRPRYGIPMTATRPD
jgi:cytochrome P450